MKTFKKIAAAIVLLLVATALGGYFYFQKKFTPPDNYLTVSGTAKNISIRWTADEGNPYAALLLPVQFNGINQTFYMQLDSGSPITVFYKNAIRSVQAKFPKQLTTNTTQQQLALQFNIGTMHVTSNRFTVLDYGTETATDHPDKPLIIGTIGTDLLEKRTIILDFKRQFCSFTTAVPEGDCTAFEFKKRKILLPVTINDKKLRFLYDSGTSGYEWITHKKKWEQYRTPNGAIKTEKGNSWGNTLTVLSAPANCTIQIGNRKLQCSEITCIEGIPPLQSFLMKFSGMQGMMGNKLFFNHILVLDCKNKKFKVE